MNTQIRRLSTVVIVMTLVLMGSLTSVQFFRAQDLDTHAGNDRAIYATYGHDRGPIVLSDGTSIAYSKASDDAYKYQRVYTGGDMYAPVTGYYSVVGQSTGIEASENSELNGTDNSMFWQQLSNFFSGKDPAGGSVELTINPAVQKAAYDAFGDQKGAAVAIDPTTGAILGMVSVPSYDPNTLATHDTTAATNNYNALVNNPDDPLYNRAIAGNLYPPGSTFKIITSAAAIESGGLNENSVVKAPTNLPLPDSSAVLTNQDGETCSQSGSMTLKEAFAMSCNTAYALIGKNLGEQTLQDQAAKFGFGKNLSIPMPVTPSTIGTNMDDSQIMMSAIGQYNDKVTPLQMAMVVSAVANNGTLETPYLVQTVRDSNLNVVSTTKPKVFSNPISPNTAKQLQDMMVGVVTDPNGTGTMAQIPGVTVGAKTGTAETGYNSDGTKQPPDVWFVCYGSVGGKQVAVAVVVEDGGDMGTSATGGAVASPIAVAMMKAALGISG